MALYKVLFRNPYYKPGTWLEELDPDVDDSVQPVHMVTENRRLVRGGNYGIVLPLRTVREYCIVILKSGLDKRW